MAKGTPTTFAGWQKKYPDAMQMKGTAKGIVTKDEAMRMIYGPDKKAKLLYSTGSCTITERGTNSRFNFIFSVQALEEEQAQKVN